MDKNSELGVIAIGKCGQFEVVKEATAKYLAGISSNGIAGILSPISVSLDFNYVELSELMNDFLQLLLREPVQCLYALRDAVWYHVNVLISQNPDYVKMCSRSVKLQQIHCSIRFVGVPLYEEKFIFRPFVHPIRLGVTAMHCVLSGLGDRGTIVKQYVWYCPWKCAENECLIIGRCPFDWTQNGDCPRCTVCKTAMKEHTDYRALCDCRWIKVHLSEKVPTPDYLERRIKRGVTVQLVDDSCDMALNLGDEYIIVGNYNPMANHFLAWNISPCD